MLSAFHGLRRHCYIEILRKNVIASKHFYLNYNIIMKLILASKSPRRKELLKNYGYDFDIVEANFKEENIILDPVETAKANALGKAQAVFNGLKDNSKVVLGADTVVFLDGEILTKPVDDRHAMSMLLRLSGRTHQVITGWAIVSKNGQTVNYTESQVVFNDLELDTILEYVKSRLPLDKAGSYGIQDGYGLVKEYKGSLNNIIGLPIEEISLTLDNELGVCYHKTKEKI